jgi:hypothetical protein
VGRFGGRDWTVIGFQERAVTAEGKDYRWHEYLLHHAEEGFRWLVEADGHWSWVSPVSNPPRYQVGQSEAGYKGEEYKRFAAGSAVTRYVIGEFTWKVAVGETWETIDFVAPPRMLSREARHAEITWSLADYLPVDEVVAAFKLDHALPQPTGIAANQPNPRAEPHRRVCAQFWKFAMLALLAQLLWVFLLGGRTVLDQRLFFATDNEEPVTTQSFRLERDARSVVLRHDTDLDNNWLGLGITLVEKTSGRAWASQTELAYWHGYDDGSLERRRPLARAGVPRPAARRLFLRHRPGVFRRKARRRRRPRPRRPRPGRLEQFLLPPGLPGPAADVQPLSGRGLRGQTLGRAPTSFPAAPSSAARMIPTATEMSGGDGGDD